MKVREFLRQLETATDNIPFQLIGAKRFRPHDYLEGFQEVYCEDIVWMVHTHPTAPRNDSRVLGPIDALAVCLGHRASVHYLGSAASIGLDQLWADRIMKAATQNVFGYSRKLRADLCNACGL